MAAIAACAICCTIYYANTGGAPVGSFCVLIPKVAFSLAPMKLRRCLDGSVTGLNWYAIVLDPAVELFVAAMMAHSFAGRK